MDADNPSEESFVLSGVSSGDVVTIDVTIGPVPVPVLVVFWDEAVLSVFWLVTMPIFMGSSG